MAIKTLAVLVAGEYRTWQASAKYLFKLFQDRADRVDYFFATWNYTRGQPVIRDDVQEPFDRFNQNLVGQIVIPQIGQKVSTFYNQAYLAKLVNILKRENELKNNFVYDQVVETRPDIYMRPNTKDWIIMKDYEVCNCGGIMTSSMGFPEIDDVYYRSTSFTNDIIANRYWHRKPANHYIHSGNGAIQNWHNHHCMIMEYFNSNGVKFVSSVHDFIPPHIAIRDHAVHVDFDLGDLESLKAEYQPPQLGTTNTDPINWH
jgi:hypothetical protein